MDELPRYNRIDDTVDNSNDDRRLEIVKCMTGCLFILLVFVILYYYDSIF